LAVAESALLTKTKLLAEPKALFQSLQTKGVVTHRLVGEALGGCGPTPAAECALLVMKKKPAKPNELPQLLQVENVITQLVFQAAIGSASRDMVTVLAAAAGVFVFVFHLAKRRELGFFKFKFKPAQAGELAELRVARPNFEKSRTGCEKQRPGFAKLEFSFLQREIERQEIGRSRGAGSVIGRSGIAMAGRSCAWHIRRMQADFPRRSGLLLANGFRE